MPRHFALSLLILLLIAKVIGVVMRGPSPLVMDANQYWQLGGEVVEGDWLLMGRPIAFRTPAYPWLVGLMRGVFPTPLFSLVCLQAAMWCATIVLTYRLATNLTGDRRVIWPILAAAAVMISSVTYVSAVLTETLFVFSLMLHLWCVVRFVGRPTVAWGVLVGLTLAVATLTRPIAQLIWVADLIYLFASWRWPAAISPCSSQDCGDGTAEAPPHSNLPCRRRTLISVVVAAAVMAICLLPWLLRNDALFGKKMITEFVGRNIWIVTFAGESGAELSLPESNTSDQLKRQLGDQAWSEMQSDQGWRNTWTMSHALTDSGLDDAQTDRLMKSVALDAIAVSPIPFAKKAARRAVNFWRTRATELPSQWADLEEPRLEGVEGGPPQNLRTLYAGQPVWGVKVAPVDTAIRYRLSNWLTGNTFLMLLTAGSTMLLVLQRETRAAGLWLAAILGYFSLVTAMLEVPGYRYRLIVEPVMLLAVALAVTRILPFSAPPSCETTSTP